MRRLFKDIARMRWYELLGWVIVITAVVLLLLRIAGIIPDAAVIAAEECRCAYYVGMF